MTSSFGHPYLTLHFTLARSISGLLRGVVYETVVRETPTGDPQEVAEQLNAFLRGGVQAANGQQPN